MFARKLQRIGTGTLFVSLPSQWVARHRLKKGDAVTMVIRDDGALIVTPQAGGGDERREAVVELPCKLENEILGKYLLGYDVIRVKSKRRFSAEERAVISSVVRKLSGLEIVDESASEMVIQSFLDPQATDPSKLLKRESLITSSMYKDAVTAVLEGDVDLAEAIKARDEDVDRLYFLLVRVLRSVVRDYTLASTFMLTPLDAMDMRLVASYLEGIGDASVQLASKAKPLRESVSSRVADALESTASELAVVQKEAVAAFLTRNPAASSRAAEKLDKLRASLALLQTSPAVGPLGHPEVELLKVCDLVKDITDLVV